jgi:DNA-binding transcriptional LysR family regulator
LRNEAVAALRDLSLFRRGAVRIGANESTSVYLLPRLTHTFHERYPEVKIEVTCGHSEELVLKLRERSVDLALLAHLPEEHELETRLIMRDELVLIVSPRHRLACAENAHLQDLETESIITEGAPSSLHEKIVEAFRDHHTPLNIHVESATIETIKKMVAAGVGVGFVPLMCVQEEAATGELVIVPIEGLQSERTLWAVRRRSDVHSHAAIAFMKVVNSLAEQLQRNDAAKSSSEDPQGGEIVDFQARKHG